MLFPSAIYIDENNGITGVDLFSNTGCGLISIEQDMEYGFYNIIDIIGDFETSEIHQLMELLDFLFN